MENDLKHRCYRFSLNVISFLRNAKWDALSMIIIKQVMRSSVSIGANVVEAKNSSSRVEFKRYYEIALKSCNETQYWLCLLRDGFDVNGVEFEKLLKESIELSKILAASVIKLKSGK